MKGRHFLRIADWSHDELEELLQLAVDLKRRLKAGEEHRLLPGRSLGMVFDKPSTRTRISFEVGMTQLGGHALFLNPNDLQLGRGETIADTALTLRGIGVRVIVVRHPESGFARRLADSFDGHVINAGDGTHAHPTQALLDLMTLRQEFRRFDGLRVAIVGDILHSRVARSNIVGMRALGIDVTLVGPATLLPRDFLAPGVRIERDLDAVLRALGVDTVIVGGLVPSPAVSASVIGAELRGYRVLLATDELVVALGAHLAAA